MPYRNPCVRRRAAWAADHTLPGGQIIPANALTSPIDGRVLTSPIDGRILLRAS